MSDVIKVDNLDRQILELLHLDARMPSSRIADQLHVTDRTVRNRIDKLLQSGLARIGLLLDQEVAGYPVVAIVQVEVACGRADEIARRLAAEESVNYVAAAIADWDLVIQVYARTNDDLYNWVNTTFAAIEGVRRTRTTIHPRLYKRPADWFPASLRSNGNERSERSARTAVSEIDGVHPGVIAAD
jgi:Lrp/AsnC family transcriptional regulator for asnA, asnC and gidA